MSQQQLSRIEPLVPIRKLVKDTDSVDPNAPVENANIKLTLWDRILKCFFSDIEWRAHLAKKIRKQKEKDAARQGLNSPQGSQQPQPQPQQSTSDYPKQK